MPDLVQFDKGRSLKVRFKAAFPIAEIPAVEVPKAEAEKPTSAGHALYMLYRAERVKQNFEEWKWFSLDIGQRLVWEKLAANLGLKI